MTIPKIIYQEASLDQMLAFWVKAYRFPDGGTLSTWTAFIDPVQRKVVFKLMVDTETPTLIVPDNGKIIAMKQ